jgi:transcriptional regulator with XRE-family HTH domain
VLKREVKERAVSAALLLTPASPSASIAGHYYGTNLTSPRPEAESWLGLFFYGEAAVVRRRDWPIDRKIGSVIRMRRLTLGLNQSDLGNALGVSFQQIQEYERGTNAVASTRISDLCRALRMTPNELFGVSSKIDGDMSELSSWTHTLRGATTGNRPELSSAAAAPRRLRAACIDLSGSIMTDSWHAAVSANLPSCQS